MKRVIHVKSEGVQITALISVTTLPLTQSEMEILRDQLADRLQQAVAGLVYLRTPLNRVKVR